MRFFLNREVLYKKGKDQILLRCVDTNETKKTYMRSTKRYVVDTLVGT